MPIWGVLENWQQSHHIFEQSHKFSFFPEVPQILFISLILSKMGFIGEAHDAPFALDGWGRGINEQF